MKSASGIYRWFMPMFLHASFLHILFNSIFGLIFGTMLESIVGQIRMMFIWIVSGMGGILFASLIEDNPSVGASTSLMGIVGALLGWLTINW
jgi:rhomboid protease GluP